MLKLPKDVVNDPRHDAVVHALTERTSKLWENGVHEVSLISVNSGLAMELQRALGLKHASQGLEHIVQQLAREQKGLDELAKKTPNQPQSGRISRVLFLANDGSERFYRECDSLLKRYGQRLLVCRLNLAGEELGKAIFGSPKLTRAILVADKKAAARVLLSLVPAGT